MSQQPALKQSLPMIGLRLLLVLSVGLMTPFAYSDDGENGGDDQAQSQTEEAAAEEQAPKQTANVSIYLTTPSTELSAAQAEDAIQDYSAASWSGSDFNGYYDPMFSLNRRMSRLNADIYSLAPTMRMDDLSEQTRTSIMSMLLSYSAILTLSANGYHEPIATEFKNFTTAMVKFNSLLSSPLRSRTWLNSRPGDSYEDRILPEDVQEQIIQRVVQEFDEIADVFSRHNDSNAARARVRESFNALANRLASSDYNEELRELNLGYLSGGSAWALGGTVGTATIALFIALLPSIVFTQDILDSIEWLNHGFLYDMAHLTGAFLPAILAGYLGFRVAKSVALKFSPFHNNMDRVRELLGTCSRSLGGGAIRRQDREE